jgi:hypothetical protein
MHCLPLPLPFFSILVGVFAVLLVLLQLGALRHAYLSIGLSPGGATLVLFGSLMGSYFNLPLVELPQQHVVAGHVVTYYGMRYVVPIVVNWLGTVIAANVGGAIIPVVVSAYLLVRYRLWLQVSPLAVACIATGGFDRRRRDIRRYLPHRRACSVDRWSHPWSRRTTRTPDVSQMIHRRISAVPSGLGAGERFDAACHLCSATICAEGEAPMLPKGGGDVSADRWDQARHTVWWPI